MSYFKPFPVADESDLRRFGGPSADCCPRMHQNRAVTNAIVCIDVPIPMKCDSMAAAINAACKLMNGGASVCQIKGSDGFIMERRDIEMECLRRREDNR
jgi:hypothetical protein